MVPIDRRGIRQTAASDKPPSRIRRRVRELREHFVFKKELRARMMSAAILIPTALFATWFGEVSFFVVVLLTGALVLYEWLRMIGAGHIAPLRWVGWIGLAMVAVAALTQPLGVAALAVVACAFVCGAVAWSYRFDIAVRWVAAGIVYAGVAVVCLIALRKGVDGFGAVVFVFLIAWASDTAAFFVGRKVGGPKLWRRVSPSKTWSGACGGLVFGTIFGVLVAAWLNVPVTPTTVMVAALVSISAQAGDLLQSAAKRRFAVKDAGSIIPGHGGVMDRVDGLMVAGLVTVVLGSLVVADLPATGLLTLMGR